MSAGSRRYFKAMALEQTTGQNKKHTPQVLARSSILLFSSQVTAKGLFFLTMVFLARVLGPAEYGQLAFAFGLVSMLSVLPRFGLDLLTTRDVAEDPSRARPYLRYTFPLRLLLSAAFLLVLFFTLLVLNKTEEVNRLVFVLGFAVIFQSLAGAGTSLFEAFQVFSYRSLLMISMYLTILLGVLLTYHLWPHLMGVGYGFLIGGAAYCILALSLCHIKIVPVSIGWNTSFSIPILGMALPLVLSEFFVSIYYRMDTILLSLFDTDSVVGWYNAAYNFVYGLRLFPLSVSMVLLPALSRLYRNEPLKAIRTYAVALRYSIVIGLFLTLLVVIGAEFFISLFFGERYGPSSRVLPVLIWTCAIIFVNALQSNFLLVVDRRATLFRATAIGAVSNVILNLLLIPRWSMFGAACATVLSELLVFLIFARSLSEFLKVRDLASFFLTPIIGAFFTAIFCVYIATGHPVLQLLVSPLIYFAAIYLLAGLPPFSVKSLLGGGK